MLTRLTRIQLAIFALVTILAMGAISAFFLHLPAKMGLGTYKVNAEFVAGGGLYPNANVTYRGVTIGRVEQVGLNHDGVVANMRLNSNTPVPDNVTATVKSVSAVGEQYVDLVPPAPPSTASTSMLANGATIGADRTFVGQDISEMLKQAEQLVGSLSNARLKDLLSETFKAFNGSGPELARMIQSSRMIIDTANANAEQTVQLIDQAGPFLDAQVRSGDDIRSLADGLARLTNNLSGADPQFRTLLQTAPGAIDEVNTAFTGIRPTFPMLAANLANLGRVGVIYHKSIEQALVIFPALLAALNTVAGGVPTDEGGKLDFKVDLGDPPTCNVGFIPATQIRSPADETLRDLPTDLYCKAAQNDPTVVRGARNYPCMQLCRDPVGFVPIGANPWRGAPIPYGTPVQDGRNILPPNKFPFIPPAADYDPGAPVVALPPGTPPGPGPAPNAPFPLPVPPNNNPPAPPWPYFAPPDQVLPPYARQPLEAPGPPPGPVPAEAGQPQAGGLTYGTYGSDGKFIDPSGNIGVFAGGVGKALPAETWVDLMSDPRQA